MQEKNRSFIKCRACGNEWIDEKINSQSMCYCPKCGMIGQINEQFKLVESKVL